jgi:tail tube protein gp19
MPLTPTSAGASQYLLELDGVVCGAVRSVKGGSATADVIGQVTRGPMGATKKGLGPPRYEPIELEVPFGLDDRFYKWVGETWGGKPRAHDGALTMVTLDGAVLARREFFQALITSVTIPKLNASSKDAVLLTVELTPERTRDVPVADDAQAPKSPARKKVAASKRNFSVEIDGLECRDVAIVDALTAAGKGAADALAAEREPRIVGTSIDFPSVRLDLSARHAGTWRDWFGSFVLEGKNGDGAEKNGRIRLLTNDLKTTIATVELHGLGIYRLDDDWTAAEVAASRRITVELYCERMSFSLGETGSVIPPPPVAVPQLVQN